jgi:hypothetical protein
MATNLATALVRRDDSEAKPWLDPDGQLARNRGFDNAELRGIERIIVATIDQPRRSWDDYLLKNLQLQIRPSTVKDSK